MRTFLALLVTVMVVLAVATVPASAAGSTLAAGDAFARTVASGWGSADTGGAYALTGTAADFSVSAGLGSMQLRSAGAVRIALLPQVSAQDVDMVFTVRVSRLPVGGSMFLYGIARHNGSREFRLNLRVTASGTVYVHASRLVSGVDSDVAAEVKVAGLVIAAGRDCNLRAQVTGSPTTTIRLKAWDHASAEPVAWAYVATDATPALQGAGSVGVFAYLGAGTTNAPVTAGFSALAVNLVAVAPVPTPSPTLPPTPSPEPTPSPTPAPTPSPDATPSPTLPPTPSPDATPSPTLPPTPSPDATPSPNPAPTPSPEPTPSPTLPPTPSPDATPSPTLPPTPSPEPTPSPDPTPSPTVAPTQTPAPAIVLDDFERTTANGFGTATIGGAYGISGTSSDYGVALGTATLRVPSGSARSANLGATSARDVDVRLALRPAALPVGGSAWLYVVVRNTSVGNEYRLKVRIDPSGAVAVGASRVTGGAEVNGVPEAIVPGLLAVPGSWLALHAQVTGAAPTRLAIRAWSRGSTEPSFWQLQFIDTTATLQAAGAIGLRAYVATSVSNGAMTYALDDFVLLPASAQPTPPDPGTAVLVGAGDIGLCPPNGAIQTAALLETIGGTVFTAGDNVNTDAGSAADFANCFGPSWGFLRSRMLPVPGNHEYNTPGAIPYFDYFGSQAGPRGLGYYASDVGTWRVYSLNSECAGVDCAAEALWLTQDLADHPEACVMAVWHEPRFSSGEHGGTTRVAPFWDALYAAGAELIVDGHDHDYERFAPMDPQGRLDSATGITEFVSGTGGAGGRTFTTIQPNSLVRDVSTLGVLKLTLRAGSYDWQFIPATASGFTDSGSTTCH